MNLSPAFRQALWPAAGLGCAALLALTPVFKTLDRAWQDAGLRWLAEPRAATATAVVDIDEASLQALQSRTGPWPYRRDVHAAVADSLLEAGARRFRLAWGDS